MTIDRAYLAGALASGGWCTKQSFGLTAIQREFVVEFARVLNAIAGLRSTARMNADGYWQVRRGNASGQFDHLPGYVPTNDAERGAWLRGLFDSKGHASIVPAAKRGPLSYFRLVAFYGTRLEPLHIACGHLDALGIAWSIRKTKNSIGHIGTETVYQLRLRRRAAFERFDALVGSSISETKRRLGLIVSTYQRSPGDDARRKQLRGAEAKHRKLMEETLPKVIQGVAALVRAGTKPTQRNCRSITGFNSIRRYFKQAELVAAAKELA